MQRLFLTFFYVGLLPKAPGTFGSIAGALVAWVILSFFSSTTLFLLSILLFLVSINIINSYENKTKIHDHSIIVIDEVVGVWLAIVLSGDTNFQLILSLIFFRFFDIKKPSIIGRVDRNTSGGFGVMFDDVLAGIFAGILSSICYYIANKLGFTIF
ncbi:phosphatidylglycerophosphatase A [Campylobacter pinnipediorum]|uniref:Phosphatidylglycerophosphatase A n=1 Tax=Campylobacter pinnipediorum subsp. pinnipediorum TaxID=1660067 RepID=A0AAX0LAQ1_9BACT|nr:phosphatidylglycerophosphatase A [Campylobacter pinnipediorum]AQW81012.1 phosphatidylglycerophosphatase A [Campylobacter pinnipediorum subsp. pinnipediorum]AQW82628.1 phosphatidylglycerophosphatase A [Campylobacter pinnipediorum subsp. pinnipediorum]AQW84314.1 phosphatidylglycerophosphatase A [Campylobacter pinnipediorum subsp. pinnipediorum]OPA77127.1 phosphatidylglycerophosphatase A [Campylobacter pinnipediorum subsp. pinnipediorum]OPA78914.1 phosphatidylglycerophosphatase A [Campylobacte